jgi:hypothetical protein
MADAPNGVKITISDSLQTGQELRQARDDRSIRTLAPIVQPNNHRWRGIQRRRNRPLALAPEAHERPQLVSLPLPSSPGSSTPLKAIRERHVN